MCGARLGAALAGRVGVSRSARCRRYSHPTASMRLQIIACGRKLGGGMRRLTVVAGIKGVAISFAALSKVTGAINAQVTSCAQQHSNI
jgi:hypothetical protein